MIAQRRRTGQQRQRSLQGAHLQDHQVVRQHQVNLGEEILDIHTDGHICIQKLSYKNVPLIVAIYKTLNAPWTGVPVLV